MVDNEALFYAVCKTRCDQFRVSDLIKKILLEVAKHNGILFMGWIPSELMVADEPSRGAELSRPTPQISDIKVSDAPAIAARYALESPGKFL